MKALLASLAVLFFSAEASAQIEGPFVPLSGAVDHVVTMVGTTGGRAPSGVAKRITHHAGWSRIERVADGRSRVEGYVGHAVHVSISLPRQTPPVSFFDQLLVFRWSSEHARTHTERTSAKTGERRVVLGETCEVWKFVPLRSGGGDGYTHFSCLTGDGIELAARTTSPDDKEFSSSEATSVELRRVGPDEVHPPAGLLSIAFWVKPEHLTDDGHSGPDAPSSSHEVTLRGTIRDRTAGGRSPEGANATQIKRRYGAWTYEEFSSVAAAPRLWIANEEVGVHLAVFRTAPASPDMLILTLRQRVAASGNRPQDNATSIWRFEEVLGEACQYFVVPTAAMPVMGEYRYECRAQDGVVLEEHGSLRLGGGGDFTAVGVRRGGVTLPSIISQSELLRPVWWGLPR